jgi:hypothetical protein
MSLLVKIICSIALCILIGASAQAAENSDRRDRGGWNGSDGRGERERENDRSRRWKKPDKPRARPEPFKFQLDPTKLPDKANPGKEKR